MGDGCTATSTYLCIWGIALHATAVQTLSDGRRSAVSAQGLLLLLHEGLSSCCKGFMMLLLCHLPTCRLYRVASSTMAACATICYAPNKVQDLLGLLLMSVAGPGGGSLPIQPLQAVRRCTIQGIGHICYGL